MKNKLIAQMIIFLLIGSYPVYGAAQTFNSLPAAHATAPGARHGFIGAESPAQLQKYSGYVLQGGIGPVSGTLEHRISALVALPTGKYVYQDETVHTYTRTTRTYVYADNDDSRAITISGASVTRSTHLVFAEMATGSDEPTTPAGAVRLMQVDTDSSSIRLVTDLRSGGEIDVEVYGSFATAAKEAPPSTLVISKREMISEDLTLPSTLGIKVLPGGMISDKGANGIDFTINGSFEAGSHQVFDFTGTGSTIRLGASSLSKPIWYGLSGSATPVVNRRAVVQAFGALGTAGGRVVFASGDFTLDSASAEIILSQNNITVEMQPDTVLRSKENDRMFIVLTGKNIHWIGGQIIGTDIWRKDTSSRPPALLAVDRTGATERANIVFENVTVRGVNSAGFLAHKAVGVDYKNCRAYGNAAYLDTLGINFYYGFYVHTSAYITYDHIYAESTGQGICGAGSATPFDSFDGVKDSGNLRHVKVTNSSINRTHDHGVYFSARDDDIVIDGNTMSGCAHAGIKIEGYRNKVTRNYCKNGIGLVGRNLVETLIDGNTFITTNSGLYAYAVNISGKQFNRNTEDIKIVNNIIRDESASGARYGISIVGKNIDANTQRVLKKIQVEGNKIHGYGAYSGALIQFMQEQISTGSVHASQVAINNNTLQFDRNTTGAAGAVIINYANNVTFSGNVLRDFQKRGLVINGVVGGIIDNNIFHTGVVAISNGASTTTDKITIGSGNQFNTVTTRVLSPRQW